MDRGIPFATAAQAVDTWLRSEPGLVLRAARELDWWELRAEHELLPAAQLRLVLPPGFPGEPPEVFLAAERCLVLPHVEASGRVCTGASSRPDDHTDPVDAVRRVLQALDELLANCRDPAWREREFARESRSYWDAYCLRRRAAADARPVPAFIDVDLTGLTGAADGALAAFTVDRGGVRSTASIFAVAGTQDPRALAERHGRAAGTFVAGHALFVRLPDDFTWTPASWPTSMELLAQLVARVSAGAIELRAWLAANKGSKPRPYAIILVHRSIAYGYLLAPAFVPGLTRIGLFPVTVRRIDADWALARDQQLPVMHQRREARVLILGGGSLGAPVAEHLARSGVGKLVIVDDETFESENTGRHVLGYASIGRFKVLELAAAISRDVPSVDVKGEPMRAARYLQERVQAGDFDLVVDCTAESSVRTVLSIHRFGRLAGTTVAMSWVEPHCAAAHVVALGVADQWPMSDPADEAVNVADWPKDPRVRLPMCGAGFHPYGSADIGQAAAFVAQRLLDIIDGTARLPTIWSRVRSREFFAGLPVANEPRSMVEKLGSASLSSEIERNFNDVVKPDSP